MKRLRFLVSYDGTAFHGWQVQPDLPTIQAALEEAIGTIEGAAVQVEGSGRTDAGVHALAQVAAVTIDNPIPNDNFRRAVNRLLPPDIRIFDVEEADRSFHPRFNATGKTYEYRIFREEVCAPFLHRYVHHHPYPLNEEAMAEGARALIGEHDFSAFAASDGDRGESDRDCPRRRRIWVSELTREGPLLRYRVRGSGFLKHMIRNIVGVLIGVGRGTLGRDDVVARLQSGCGIAPGPTAPASGLFLISVDYGAPQDDGVRVRTGE